MSVVVIDIPLLDSSHLNLTLKETKPTFILGANGTGKSSLVYFIFTQLPNVTRINAHRSNWLDKESIAFSAGSQDQYVEWINNSNKKPESRWKDDHHLEKPKIVLTKLIDYDNKRSREIARLVDQGKDEEARCCSAKPSVLNLINQLFKVCNILVEIEVLSNDKVVAKKNGNIYSVAKMSDGEKNALLIAIDVLAAEKGKLVIIDEPERHLHQAITVPFINNLIELRPDLKFLISTHDISFAHSFNDSQFLLLNSCSYLSESNVKWDANLISKQDIQDLEGLSVNLLGARKNIIFVEGVKNSLDLPLYSLIFPNISIIPLVSCRDVMQSVRGIKATASLHWLNVFGVIDGDGRAEEEKDSLLSEDIFCLDQYSIEGIYYHPFLQQKIYNAKLDIEGSQGITEPRQFIDEVITQLISEKQRLCNRVIEKAVRNKFEAQIPNQKTISSNDSHQIAVDLKQIREVELALFDSLVQNKNIAVLLSRYPIRETGVLNLIAKKLGFLNRGNYENAVITRLHKDSECLDFIKSIFQKLTSKMN